MEYVRPPKLIMVDRNEQQLTTIEKTMKNTEILYCKVHIERSLTKYFHGTILMEVYYMYTRHKISGNVLIEAMQKIIENNNNNINENKNKKETKTKNL